MTQDKKQLVAAGQDGSKTAQQVSAVLVTALKAGRFHFSFWFGTDYGYAKKALLRMIHDESN